MPEQMLQKDDSRSLNFLSTLNSIATKRSLKPYAKGEQITYEFTEDPALLHQYYRIRQVMYDKVFHTKNYNWGEDHYDRLGRILVARRGRLCLGGCRLIIREADEAWDLPMEKSDFNIRKLFPELPLDMVRHAEISRLTVMDDCGEDVLQGLYKAMYRVVTNSDINYLFVKSPYRMARNWRLVANSFGVKSTKIVENIHPVDDTLSPDIMWYLTLSDLTSFCSDNSVTRNVIENYYNDVSETLN